jgi:hypothetical protein
VSAWLAATLVAIALFWIVDLVVLRAGVPDPLDDTWEYGVAARQVLAGHGFRTEVIHPPLWTLRDSANTVPVLIHGPLLPLIVAPLLRMFGDRAMDHFAWVSAAFALLAALALFRMAARRFGPDAGAGAALLFTLAPGTLRAVHHDPSLLLGGALLVLALDLASGGPGSGVRAGIALGLASLARPEMLSALPAVLLLARGRARLAALLASVACLAPWWIHNLRACSAPLFNLSSYLLIGYWGARPGLSVIRDFDLTPARWPSVLAGSMPLILEKARDFFPHAIKRALLTPTGGTGWLAPIGALAAPRRRVAASVLLAAIPVGIMTLTVYDDRYLTPFLPLWALAAALGARGLASFLPAWGRGPRTWITLLVLMALATSLPTLMDAAREARAFEARLALERAALAARPAPDGGLMFSDTPDFVAFTTGRPTVWLTRAEYMRLPMRGTPSSVTSERPARGDSLETWFHDAEPMR